MSNDDAQWTNERVFPLLHDESEAFRMVLYIVKEAFSARDLKILSIFIIIKNHS
jgi:hypothetical protein